MMNRIAGRQKPTRKHRGIALTPRALEKGLPVARRGGLSPAAPTPANDIDLAHASDLDLESVLPEALAVDGVLAGAEPGLDAVAELDSPLLAANDGEVGHVAGPDVEADGEESEEQDEDEKEEISEEGVLAASRVRAKRVADEPASFLGMYFRDMAALDVLRPEQEFETARQIEAMETDLWKTILGFAPGASWIADTVDRSVEHPLPEMKTFRAVADRSRKRASIQARSRFEKEIARIATKLRVMDIDRIYLDSAVAEINRVGRGIQGLPFEGQVPFSTGTKAFRDYVRTTGLKAFRLKQAKNEFVTANLRLVVSIARRFNHGRLPLADLIQEGNIGLMKAVERYDYRRGFRFSTYASWWIRHAISRALADKGRAVRLPVHMIDAYHRIAKSQRELQSKLERPPSTEELAAATGIEADKLEKMKTFLAESPVSLDRPISDDDGRRLIDVLVDPEAGPAVPDQMSSSETQSEMLKLLGDLRPIEADILRKRFGLENDRERTLKEIGDEYSLSRERVRQLQEQALGKMRRAMAKRESV
jgi:RNA polymerase primary sigma factor